MKVLIIRITTILLLNISFFSCNEKKINKDESVINSINKKWIGKQIVIPPSVLPFAVTLSKKAPTKYTIIAFYDGNCSMCYIELKKWKKTMSDSKELGFNNVTFKFILSGNSKSVVDYHLTELGFPIDLAFYDSKDEFNTQFPFLKEPGYKYSSILLDEKEKVLFIGNPTISDVDNDRFLTLIK